MQNNIETIGIRAFSQAVSSYLKKVQLGVRILISDRGKVIGEIVQPGATPLNPNIPYLAQKLVLDEVLSLGSSFDREGKSLFKFPRGGRISSINSSRVLSDTRGEN